MTFKRALSAIVPVVLAAAAAGCGGGSASGDSAGGGSAKLLTGAGSTFVFPLVSKWIPDYSQRNDVTITYGPVGSGGGIQSVTSRIVDFGASDAPLAPDQASACTCVQVPWALAGTSIPYNLEGAPAHLKLSGALLADIFLGKVTSWDDPAIAKLNPGVTLPAVKITPVHRSDSSGTTYNVTDYLAKASPAWKDQIGTGTEVSWPTGVGGKGSTGMAGVVSRTNGAIGYVDAAYAIENELAYASIQNRAGAFVLPTAVAVTAAAAAVREIPADNAVSIVDPPAGATAAYPIATYTFAIVPKDAAKAAALKAFLEYAISDGQQFAADLQFAPLPQAILDADRKAIASVGT